MILKELCASATYFWSGWGWKLDELTGKSWQAAMDFCGHRSSLSCCVLPEEDSGRGWPKSNPCLSCCGFPTHPQRIRCTFSVSSGGSAGLRSPIPTFIGFLLLPNILSNQKLGISRCCSRLFPITTTCLNGDQRCGEWGGFFPFSLWFSTNCHQF